VLLATDPGGPDAVRADPQAWATLIDTSGSPRQQATRLLSVLFPPKLSTRIDRLVGDVVAAARAQVSVPSLRCQEAAIDQWHSDEPPQHPEGVRVLVATGNEDVLIPPENAPLLSASWQHCPVEVFSGCGHAFMAQEGVRLAGLIEAFVRSG
jgi:pimeloyl-ACP methyl ester carboxylesterase